MLPSHNPFKNFHFLSDFHSTQPENNKNVVQDEKYKNLETQEIQGQQEIQIKCRSRKNKVDLFEISFEADFLVQHQESFKCFLQNYLETSLKRPHSKTYNFQSPELFAPYFVNSPSEKDFNLKFEGNCCLSKQQKIQFSRDIEPEDKLTQFLTMLQTTLLKQVSDQLIYISFLVWENYIENRKPLLKHKDISTLAEKFSSQNHQNLFTNQVISFLNLRKVKESMKMPLKDIKEGFKHFLTRFAETLFLVVEEYFENPYYKSSQKRKREEDWEDEDGEQELMFPLTQEEESDTHRQYPSKARKFF